MAHAPLLTGGPETTLVGVWGRRPEMAQALADELGSTAVAPFDELLEVSDAVAFAVPPGVQGELAITAARAGKHLLLDKPVAGSLDDARSLAAAVDAAGVVSMVLLTLRFTESVRRFVSAALAAGAVGVAYESLSGGFLAGPFSASPWRKSGGILPDVGPHVVDLMDSLLGPVATATVTAQDGLVRLALHHAGGGFSHAVLGAHHTGPPVRSLRAYAADCVVDCDWTVPDDDLWGTVRREFASAVAAGRPHAADVHRGLELQRVLAMVGADTSSVTQRR
jgi:predicted dehydrogenase